MKALISYLILIVCCVGFSQDKNYSITNLKMNTEYPHFGLMYIGGNEVLFTSYKLNKKGKLKGSIDNATLTIYTGTLSGNGEIINTKPVQIDPKANIEHITSATISPNGDLLYLTTYYTNKNRPKGKFKATNFHIEVGEFVDGVGWTNFKVLPFCKPKYSYAHPALSVDGKTLYFIANAREGKETTKGGSDIFKVDILGNNTYSEPKNLGSKINSYSREMFPFISSDNVLYFSSNRPNGVGGFDIYKSELNSDGEFEKAQLMPKPINSRASDLSFIVAKSNTHGYVASKRKGGKGDDDIYHFTLD